MNNRVLFYTHVKDISLISDISFYAQDVKALRDMGYDVLVTNRFLDIFRKRYSYLFVWWWSRALVPVIWGRLVGRKVCIAGAFHYATPLMEGTDYIRRSFLYRLLVRLALLGAHANIFVSKREYDDATTNLPVSNPALVYHGIDIDMYKPLPERELLLGEHTSFPTVLSISWLEKNNIRRKCLLESLRAINRLYLKGIKVDFIIVGRRGDGYDEILELVATLECRDHISLLGHVTEGEKIMLLQRAGIFLCPTLYEGFGVAIAEALACGCPVITSPNGAVPEVVGDCALYADPLSEIDIAEKIEYLLSKPELQNSLSRRSRERIVNLFSYESHMKSLSRVIQPLFRVSS